jgi:hypothetical protein
MPAVTFRQCTCGVELKVLYEVNDSRQFYTCAKCDQTLELVGTVLNLYTCNSSSFGRERNWIRVPRESLRSSPKEN